MSVLITSCLSYEDVKITRVVSTDVKKFSSETVEVEVVLQINNPNNYKISITNSNLDVFLNNSEIGKATIKEKIVIPGKSNEVHRFTLKLKNMDLKAGTMPAILSAALGGGMRLTVKGYIKVKAKMISKKVPLKFSENISR
ncbi:MAG: LEA type 2 family protein [Bacteroidota bacterium]